MFLTVLYAGFAALTFSFSHSIIEEHAADEREEDLHHQHKMTPHHHFNNTYNGNGYIGERFDVHRSRGPNAGGVGFVPTPADVATLT